MNGSKDKLVVTMEQAEAADALDKSSVEKVHDASEFEAKMVKEELDRLNAEPDQEEIACMMIKLYTPRFEQLVDQMSNRQLRRLLKSLMSFPLGKDYNHKEGIEAEAFKIGQGLKDAGMVLIIKTYNDHKEEIIEMAAEAAKNTTVEYGEQKQEEVSNG